MSTYKPEIMSRYNRERRSLLRAVGLCVDCGSVRASKGHVLCDTCLEARRLRFKARYYEIYPGAEARP